MGLDIGLLHTNLFAPIGMMLTVNIAQYCNTSPKSVNLFAVLVFADRAEHSRFHSFVIRHRKYQHLYGQDFHKGSWRATLWRRKQRTLVSKSTSGSSFPAIMKCSSSILPPQRCLRKPPKAWGNLTIYSNLESDCRFRRWICAGFGTLQRHYNFVKTFRIRNR